MMVYNLGISPNLEDGVDDGYSGDSMDINGG